MKDELVAAFLGSVGLLSSAVTDLVVASFSSAAMSDGPPAGIALASRRDEEATTVASNA
jgi:hypothetical protein